MHEAGGWRIFGSDQAAQGLGNTLDISTLECSTGSGDGTVQATNVEGTSAGNSGLYFRSDGTGANGFYARYEGGGYTVYRRGSSSDTFLSGGVVGTAAVNDVISVVLSGTSITLKNNGTTIWSGTDSNFTTNTKHGLRSASATAKWDTWSFVGGAPLSLTQADPSVTVTSDTTITLVAPATAGGTSPYSYQWKRSTAANGSYSNVGTNSLSLADSSSLVAGTTYWYTLTATDSAGSPQTVTTNPVPAKLSGKAYKVRVIGDSHWATPDTPTGSTNAAPAEFVARLGAILAPRAVSLGANSAASGTRSANWIPGASGTALETAVTAANSSGDNLYVVELGSNDSTASGDTPITAATFGSNMALIVNYIKANATGTPLTIALLHPFYYYQPTGTPAGFDLPTSLNALFSYAAQLDALADGVTVFAVGLATRYQIVTAQSTYLYSDKLHLSNPAGQKLSADLAAMDLAGQLQFLRGYAHQARIFQSIGTY